MACTCLLKHVSGKHGTRLEPVAWLAWCRCDSIAPGNCSLATNVSKAIPWTEMKPGDCALLYLNRSESGFSNSPRLSGDNFTTEPSLRYWTGAHYPGHGSMLSWLCM